MLRYAKIKKCEAENGIGVGASLFVQGCHFHCQGCFNQETWDFEGGEELTEEVEEEFMEAISPWYINRVSILGGEPLAPEHRGDVFKLIVKIKRIYPEKEIWLYTGYTYEEIKDIYGIRFCDYIVDGVFKEELKDISLRFRGSRNQNIWRNIGYGVFVKEDL